MHKGYLETTSVGDWMRVLLDHLLGNRSGALIQLKYLRDGRRRGGRSERKHSLDCTWNPQEGQLAGKERGDSNLVGGVEGNAVRLRGCGSLVRQPQTGEAFEIRRLKVELLERCHVERKIAGDALRPGERVEDRQAHVGD